MYLLLFFFDRVWLWSMNVLFLIVCFVYNYKVRFVILELYVYSVIFILLNSIWFVLLFGYYVVIFFFCKNFVVIM